MARDPEQLPDLQKRGYSDDEVCAIYELARLMLEGGYVRNAEPVFVGLTEIAPHFASGWIGLSAVHLQNGNIESALFGARQAHRADPASVEAMLLLIAVLLSTNDLNTAGSLLGEVQDKIESGTVANEEIVRFYKAQLARYQHR